MTTVLDDYSKNIPQAREPEVLNTMSTFINQLDVRNTMCMAEHFLIVLLKEFAEYQNALSWLYMPKYVKRYKSFQWREHYSGAQLYFLNLSKSKSVLL